MTHLKAHAADILRQIAEDREPILITQNGEAKAILQDVVSYEEAQETMALLKLLLMGQQEIDAGHTRPLAEVARTLHASLRP